MVYVGPSVSPRGFINPAMRMYYLDENTFDLLDYDNYHLDLEKVTGVFVVSLKGTLHLFRDIQFHPSVSIL